MKPFNLEHAKVGALVALEDGKDRPHLASTKGYVSFGPMNSSKRLVMRPVGTLEGREVYHGDELRHTTPGNGNIVNMTINASQPYMDFTDGVFTERYWSWPATYPKTRMTGAQLLDTVGRLNEDGAYYAEAVANAAIRHGIDNGYLMSLEGRTQREVAIARHFYNGAKAAEFERTSVRQTFQEWITAELAKVKP